MTEGWEVERRVEEGDRGWEAERREAEEWMRRVLRRAGGLEEAGGPRPGGGGV